MTVLHQAVKLICHERECQQTRTFLVDMYSNCISFVVTLHLNALTLCRNDEISRKLIIGSWNVVKISLLCLPLCNFRQCETLFDKKKKRILYHVNFIYILQMMHKHSFINDGVLKRVKQCS